MAISANFQTSWLQYKSAEQLNLTMLWATCQKIAKAFEEEKHLLAIEPSEILLSFLNELSVIGLNEKREPVCHTRLIPLNGWFELGSTWVHPDYRSQGLNLAMYRKFLPRHIGKDIFATTTNPSSLKVGEQLGFVTVTRKQLPIEVWQASCVCPKSKTGEQGPQRCHLAFGENQGLSLCYYRITPETAERHGLLPKNHKPPTL